MLHEQLSEFTVSLVHNLVQNAVVPVEVWLDQVELLLTLPETADFQPDVHEAVRGGSISDLVPQSLLKLWVGQGPLAYLSHIFSLIR